MSDLSAINLQKYVMQNGSTSIIIIIIASACMVQIIIPATYPGNSSAHVIGYLHTHCDRALS